MTDSSPKIVRRPAVEATTGLRCSKFYQHMQAGIFPKPIRLGPKAVGWLESEVLAWIETRTDERDAA